MAEYTIAVKILGKDEASKVLGGLKGTLGDLGQNLQSLGTIALGGLGALAGAAGTAGAALTKLALDAAPLEGIEAAFYGITEASGVMGDEMLAALEKGSAGMVAQRDLMTSYNQAAQLVGDQFANQLPQAMEYLRKVSAATGEDMSYMMDSLVRGVGRMSPMILDNLGIQVDLTEAYEDWAKEAGKAVATTVDHSEAIGKLSQDVGFLEREVASAEAAFHKENAELIHAKQIWGETAPEIQKFQDRVDKAALALDKKRAKLAEQQGALGKLQSEHGKTVASTDKLVESMTKAEQQEALMAHVMKQLAENTEAMPDVTDNAATSIAALQAKFQNIKDAVGKAFLPVVAEVVGKLSELADKVIPAVVPVIENLVDAIEAFASGTPTDFPWEDIFPDWLANIMYTLAGIFESLPLVLANIATKLSEMYAAAQPIVSEVVEWIARFVSWEDVLVAVGICIATVIIPIIVSLIAGIAPLIATAAGLIAVIALLRNAWESDWHGIRTALTDFWEKTGRPALEQLWRWLQVSIPAAIQALSNFWQSVLLPALRTAWSFIEGSILPILGELWLWLQENVPLAVETLAMFWNEILLPALEAVWAFIQDYIVPLFISLVNVEIAALSLAVEVLADIWRNVLWPALEKVWSFIQANVIPALEALAQLVQDNVGPALQWLNDKVLTPLKDTFEKIKDIIKKVIGFLEDLADAIGDVDLPSWAEPGSPPPLETAFRGIASAVLESAAALAEYRRGLEGLGGLAGFGGIGPAGAAGAAGGAGMIILAPVFLDSRDVVTAAGEIDYQAVGERLKELQGGI